MREARLVRASFIWYTVAMLHRMIEAFRQAWRGGQANFYATHAWDGDGRSGAPSLTRQAQRDAAARNWRELEAAEFYHSRNRKGCSSESRNDCY
jgi:hypothetical protein